MYNVHTIIYCSRVTINQYSASQRCYPRQTVNLHQWKSRYKCHEQRLVNRLNVHARPLTSFSSSATFDDIFSVSIGQQDHRNNNNVVRCRYVKSSERRTISNGHMPVTTSPLSEALSSPIINSSQLHCGVFLSIYYCRSSVGIEARPCSSIFRT